MEGYRRSIPAAQHVSWEVFLELEAERVERESHSIGNRKPVEPARDMVGLRAELHREHG